MPRVITAVADENHVFLKATREGFTQELASAVVGWVGGVSPYASIPVLGRGVADGPTGWLEDG